MKAAQSQILRSGFCPSGDVEWDDFHGWGGGTAHLWMDRSSCSSSRFRDVLVSLSADHSLRGFKRRSGQSKGRTRGGDARDPDLEKSPRRTPGFRTGLLKNPSVGRAGATGAPLSAELDDDVRELGARGLGTVLEVPDLVRGRLDGARGRARQLVILPRPGSVLGPLHLLPAFRAESLEPALVLVLRGLHPGLLGRIGLAGVAGLLGDGELALERVHGGRAAARLAHLAHAPGEEKLVVGCTRTETTSREGEVFANRSTSSAGVARNLARTIDEVRRKFEQTHAACQAPRARFQTGSPRAAGPKVTYLTDARDDQSFISQKNRSRRELEKLTQE